MKRTFAETLVSALDRAQGSNDAPVCVAGPGNARESDAAALAVPVRIRLAHVALMRMLGVWVTHMAMFMLQLAVLMFVNVAFVEMQPKSRAHRQAREQRL